VVSLDSGICARLLALFPTVASSCAETGDNPIIAAESVNAIKEDSILFVFFIEITLSFSLPQTANPFLTVWGNASIPFLV